MRIALLAAALCACAAPRPAPGVVAPEPRTRHPLPAGAVVLLLPVELTAGAAEGHAALIGGLWREALRQSPHLDFAPPEETTAPQALVLALDAQAGVLSSALRAEGQAVVPLAQVQLQEGLEPAIDHLALVTRRALGDPGQTADTSMPVAALYSSVPRCVTANETAVAELARGDLRSAVARLRSARVADPGCTLTLALLAEVLLDLGDGGEAEKVAREALALEARLGAVTAHRVARTLLLARPEPRAGLREQELLQLALAGRSERPHDPQVAFTHGLALNLQSRFAEAVPVLRALAARWRTSSRVPYQLAFAELGAGDPAAALRALDAAADRLPRYSVLLPRALALWTLHRDAELARELEQLAAEGVVQKSPLRHELLRLQASHALLTGRGDAAARFLLEDLEWIRQRPSKLAQNALDVVEAAEVLVRLERAKELEPRLQAFLGLEQGAPGFGETLTYLLGLVAVANGKEAVAVDAGLERQDLRLWSLLLRAAGHRRHGELVEEGRVLAQAALATDDPLVHASLARALRAAGNEAAAREILDGLRTRLTRIDLQRPREHALLSPGRALAYLATESK